MLRGLFSSSEQTCHTETQSRRFSSAGHRERSAGHTESAVGCEIAASSGLHPKLGRNAAVWGGFNKINKLIRRVAPAPEAGGGAKVNERSICDRLTHPIICITRFYFKVYRVERPSAFAVVFCQSSRPKRERRVSRRAMRSDIRPRGQGGK